MGAQFQKLFPEPHGGYKWVRSVLGPLPMLKILPSNNVNPENAADYLHAGAAVLGAGNSYLMPEAKPGGKPDWAVVEGRARSFLRAISDYRAEERHQQPPTKRARQM